MASRPPPQPVIPDGKSSTEFKCLTSLVFITHPLVLQQLRKRTKSNLIEIKALKDGVQKWQAGNGHINNPQDFDNIDLLYYVLVFDRPVTENDFGNNIGKTTMAASISDRKIISGEEGKTEVKSLSAENKSIVGKKPNDITSKTTMEDGAQVVEASTYVITSKGNPKSVKVTVPVKVKGSKSTPKARERAVAILGTKVKTITAETFELGITRINENIEVVEAKIEDCGENPCDELKEELEGLIKLRKDFYEIVRDQQVDG